MGIVCRPVLLHNEYVPARTGKRDWNYRMFGHYDGMTLLESFPLDNAENYEKLFDTCKEYDKKEQSYFTQILFGFHTDIEKEREFWKSKMPFLYTSLLHHLTI